MHRAVFCPFETPLKGSRETLKTSCVVPQNTLILTGSSPHTLRYIHFLYIYIKYIRTSPDPSGSYQHLVFKTLRHCTKKGNSRGQKITKKKSYFHLIPMWSSRGWMKQIGPLSMIQPVPIFHCDLL